MSLSSPAGIQHLKLRTAGGEGVGWASEIVAQRGVQRIPEDIMAQPYQELRQLSKDDLIRQYDRIAPSTLVGLAFIREEIA